MLHGRRNEHGCFGVGDSAVSLCIFLHLYREEGRGEGIGKKRREEWGGKGKGKRSEEKRREEKRREEKRREEKRREEKYERRGGKGKGREKEGEKRREIIE